MQLRKLNISDEKDISFVENLYTESFPPSERRSVEAMLNLFEKKKKFAIDIVVKNDQQVGFLTYWDLGEFVFAEHFAIAPEARNGGIGAKVMNLFIAEAGKPIVLEVELPSTILSERRIGFYQRLGFKYWEDVPYQQPPYLEDGKPIPMKLMTIGSIDLGQSFSEIKDTIYSEVYNF
jgi:ribosomal protein S18 acetylase RimI-like enzyme